MPRPRSWSKIIFSVIAAIFIACLTTPVKANYDGIVIHYLDANWSEISPSTGMVAGMGSSFAGVVWVYATRVTTTDYIQVDLDWEYVDADDSGISLAALLYPWEVPYSNYLTFSIGNETSNEMLELYVTGTSPSVPDVAPTGKDLEIYGYNDANSAETFNVCPVTVVLPYYIGTFSALSGVDGAGTKGLLNENSTTPIVWIDPGWPIAPDVAAITTYLRNVTVPVTDQYGNPLPYLYAGLSIFELDSTAGWVNIQRTLSASSDYGDPVGRVIQVFNSPDKATAAWYDSWWTYDSTGHPPTGTALGHVDQNIMVKVGDFQLNSNVVRRIKWTLANPPTISSSSIGLDIPPYSP